MFPTKANDPYIQNNGTRTTLGSIIGAGGGGSDLPEYSQADAGKVLKVGDDGDLEWDQQTTANYMTQTAWDALTFAQKQAAGLTLIGTDGDVAGSYYDYSDISNAWRYDPDHANCVNFKNKSSEYNFNGFYSQSVGDVITLNNRGGTRSANDKIFICLGSDGNGYNAFLAFARTEAALAMSNPSYYTIVKVSGHNLYVGGNITGAWLNRSDVSLKHDDVTQVLSSIYNPSTFTMVYDKQSTAFIIDPTYDYLLNLIEVFLQS